MENKNKKICTHCKLEVDPKASRCPHCQGKIYVWTLGRKILWGFVGLILFSFIIGLGTSDSTPSSSSSTVSTSGPVSHLTTGKEAVLTGLSTEKQPAVFPTINALKDFISLAVANDSQGMAEVFYYRGGFFVEKNTKVLILDTNELGMTKFRIIEGEHKGETGWATDEALKAE